MQCRDIISIILPGKPKVGIHGKIARKKSERLKHILFKYEKYSNRKKSSRWKGVERRGERWKK